MVRIIGSLLYFVTVKTILLQDRVATKLCDSKVRTKCSNVEIFVLAVGQNKYFQAGVARSHSFT